jgi:hypothetical protein
MTSVAPICPICVKKALAENDKKKCKFFGTDRGCRNGIECPWRHETVCTKIGVCKDLDCCYSHPVLECPHNAAAAAAQPSPAASSVSDAGAAAASSVSDAGAAAAKKSTLSAETPVYVPVEILQMEIDALSTDNEQLLCQNDALIEKTRQLLNTNMALVHILKSMGLTQAAIDEQVNELTRQPEEE